IVGAAPRMKHRAPAAFAVRIDQFADRYVEARLAQRVGDQAALPVAVTRDIPVLHLATAAHAEVRTDRRDALRTRALDAQQMAAIGMAGERLDLHDLTRQRVGHEHRPARRIRDAVTAMAEPFDSQALDQSTSLTSRPRKPLRCN